MPRSKKPAALPAEKAATETVIPAFKGFSEDMTCRDFKFEIGKTYRHEGKVVACESGFHACEHPLDVFRYYPPATSRYALVDLAGETARHDEDTKIAAAQITVRAEIHLPEMIAAAVRYVMERVKWIDGRLATEPKTGVRCDDDGGAATASGDWGAATASGRRGAATASGVEG
ncbi:MAG: hypothetical protein KDJ53_11170, partial [Rhodobiaceae bacterium]|nr:hypothetical protein [Rhodobiaceae bacterium]